MIHDWVWGKTPSGFKRIALRERSQTMIVRDGLESYLSSDGFLERAARDEPSDLFYGRTRLRTCRLSSGETVLVRLYHHGGKLRRYTRDVFFTWPPRPFRELAITEEVRRRGISTADILGAGVQRAWGPLYRGWLITRELSDTRDLRAAFQDDAYAESAREALIQSVARSIRHMHRQGVYHGDLNLRNLLVQRDGDRVKVFIIDFDKARLFRGEVPKAKAQENLSRLHRSICKLDPERRYLSHGLWEVFLQSYQRNDRH